MTLHPQAGTVWSGKFSANCGRISDGGSFTCTEPDLHGGSCDNPNAATPQTWTAANAARGFGTPTASPPATTAKTCKWNTTWGGGAITHCGHAAIQTRGGQAVCDYHADRADASDYKAGPVPLGWPASAASVPAQLVGLAKTVYAYDPFGWPDPDHFAEPTPTDAKKCECGAAKLGTKPFAIGHASYCPVST